VVLYYGNILAYDPENIFSKDRDRFIVSKGHGAVSLYPILADLNFFDKRELEKLSKEHALLGIIPDTAIPGFETTNGSLGHGLGVACGIAMALKRNKSHKKVFVLSGDGELNSGAVWEAVMFAGFHKLDNLILIIDNNKLSMLDYQKNILGLEPLDNKFKAFGWKTENVEGHNIEKLYHALKYFKNDLDDKPKVLIADTIKGNGVPSLQNDSLCHIRSLKPEEIDSLLENCPCTTTII
jgi:transketolase